MTSERGVVLTIEDDDGVREGLVAVLTDVGLRVIEASNGQEARSMVAEFQPDVVLLDLGLPDVSGLDMLTELSNSSHPMAIIVLSNRSGETDRVIGLDLGADDYVVKPFSRREVVARVRAALRRQRSDDDDDSVIESGGLRIDRRSRDVTVDGVECSLTAKEFDLLVYLAESPRRVFTRQQLLRDVWGSSRHWQDEATVGEHVHRIRRKLDGEHRRRFIDTIRGVGYRFVLDDGTPEPPTLIHR
jgi:DNA-binding response OmpR family regulator